VAYVYLLRCADDSLYCGWTVDLARRLAAHESGKASKYTARRLPVRMAAAWESESARKLEWAIKQLSRAEKERLVAGAPLAGATALPLPEAVEVARDPLH
jgi:putative endonuclease